MIPDFITNSSDGIDDEREDLINDHIDDHQGRKKNDKGGWQTLQSSMNTASILMVSSLGKEQLGKYFPLKKFLG